MQDLLCTCTHIPSQAAVSRCGRRGMAKISRTGLWVLRELELAVRINHVWFQRQWRLKTDSLFHAQSTAWSMRWGTVVCTLISIHKFFFKKTTISACTQVTAGLNRYEYVSIQTLTLNLALTSPVAWPATSMVAALSSHLNFPQYFISEYPTWLHPNPLLEI